MKSYRKTGTPVKAKMPEMSWDNPRAPFNPTGPRDTPRGAPLDPPYGGGLCSRVCARMLVQASPGDGMLQCINGHPFRNL
eukprot:801401-Pelagomonas_calceolata.AAC.1